MKVHENESRGSLPDVRLRRVRHADRRGTCRRCFPTLQIALSKMGVVQRSHTEFAAPAAAVTSFVEVNAQERHRARRQA